jgi:serpin B
MKTKMNIAPVTVWLLAAITAISLSACGDRGGEEAPAAAAPIEELAPSDWAIEAESATDADIDAAAAVTRFGIDLYRSLKASGSVEGNLIVSPISVAAALGMLLPGTMGEAQQALLQVLHLPDVAVAQTGLAHLTASMRSRADDDGVRLDLANRAFVQSGYALREPYLESLRDSGSEPMADVDYEGDAEAARRQINAWVAERTNRLITELLAQGTVDAATRLTLVNTVYLLADWSQPFDAERTAPAMFRLGNGDGIEVPMMRDTRTVPLSVAEDYRAAELVYAGEALSLLLIVPEDLDRFVSSFDLARLESIIADLRAREASLMLPKLDTRSRSALAGTVAELGAPQIFEPDAGWLTGIADDRSLHVSGIAHETVLRMDEKGTEAAAATGITIGVTSLPPPPVEIHADRPYLLILRDRETGAVLFLGDVVDPR